MYRLERLPYVEDLWSRIVADWNAVYSRSGSTSAFLAPGWMCAWFEAFGRELRPEALIWRRSGGDPCGIAVVSLRSERAGPVAIRAAYLNATGEQRVASEHNRVLCAADARTAVLDGLVAQLRASGAEMLRLCGFEAADATALEDRWPPGPAYGFTSEDRYAPLAALRAGGQPYQQTLSRNTREQVRRSMRLYERKSGPITCQRLVDDAAMDAAFDELRSLHEARWRVRGQAGVFADPRVLQFHLALRRQRDAHGGPVPPAVEFVRVRAGDATVGLLYNLLHAGRVNFYQSGFNYEADGKLKPGLVTHALAIQQYADAGFDEYHFLAGEPDAVQYKVSLGREVLPLMWCDLSTPSLKMKAVDGLRRLRCGLRRSTSAR